MKLNSLLLLPAIITVGIMPIVSISLFGSQPAFSQEKPKPSNQKPAVTPPVKNERGGSGLGLRPLGSGLRPPGSGGSDAGSQISGTLDAPNQCLLDQRNGIVQSAECPGGSTRP